MPEINKAEVYRKAAEIIVRDGQAKSTLVNGPVREITNPRYSVCALGACARAEYELYGTLPLEDGDLDPYGPYTFYVSWDNQGYVRNWSIHSINDMRETSAEDIALLLKRRAEEVEGDSTEA